MSNQDNKGVEEKDQVAPAGQNKEVENNESGASPEKEQVDYKAELDRVTKERDNYKQGMLNAKDELKKKKPSEDEEKADDDIDAKIDAIIKEKLSGIDKLVDGKTFESVIGNYSDNPDEQALIKYHFEHSVSQNLPINERIENAKLIANKSAIFKHQNELTAALKSKMGISKVSAASGGNQDIEKVTKEIFSPEQIEVLKKRGLDPEKVKENFLKLQKK